MLFIAIIRTISNVFFCTSCEDRVLNLLQMTAELIRVIEHILHIYQFIRPTGISKDYPGLDYHVVDIHL